MDMGMEGGDVISFESEHIYQSSTADHTYSNDLPISLVEVQIHVQVRHIACGVALT